MWGLLGATGGAIGGLLRESRRRRARMMKRMPKDKSPTTIEALTEHYGSSQAKTIAWRIEQLVAAGFDELRAATIATTHGADWRRAIMLVENGCEPKIAADIVL